MIAYLDKSAVISPDGLYRYELRRVWNRELPLLGICGLNPSTADALEDDPTIRREVGFASAWGFGGLLKVNLYAFRSTDPKGLRGVLDPVGRPENDHHIHHAALEARMFVAGWGALSGPNWLSSRASKVLWDLGKLVDVYAFRITAKGMPQHPLYIAANEKPVIYRARRAA